MSRSRRRAFLTIDFEDYRCETTNENLRNFLKPNPMEVERQLDMLLGLLDSCCAVATFFALGRLTSELKSSSWKDITSRHRLGCHGYEHVAVSRHGPGKFREDLHKAKSALEDASGCPIVAYRAPYFSSDGCDPWFGESLARLGFKIDSSHRINSPPPGFNGMMSLSGSDNSVIEVPLCSIGIGAKRITVIGGTYFRLFSLGVIKTLLERAERKGFLPVVYLHNYDVDAAASPLDFPKGGYWGPRAWDLLRRTGRSTVGDKLRQLAFHYEFHPLESILAEQA